MIRAMILCCCSVKFLATFLATFLSLVSVILWIADFRGKVMVAIVRSLSMIGLMPVRFFQLVSLFMSYPAFLRQFRLRGFDLENHPILCRVASLQVPVSSCRYKDSQILPLLQLQPGFCPCVSAAFPP